MTKLTLLTIAFFAVSQCAYAASPSVTYKARFGQKPSDIAKERCISKRDLLEINPYMQDDHFVSTYMSILLPDDACKSKFSSKKNRKALAKANKNKLKSLRKSYGKELSPKVQKSWDIVMGQLNNDVFTSVFAHLVINGASDEENVLLGEARLYTRYYSNLNSLLSARSESSLELIHEALSHIQDSELSTEVQSLLQKIEELNFENNLFRARVLTDKGVADSAVQYYKAIIDDKYLPTSDKLKIENRISNLKQYGLPKDKHDKIIQKKKRIIESDVAFNQAPSRIHIDNLNNHAGSRLGNLRTSSSCEMEFDINVLGRPFNIKTISCTNKLIEKAANKTIQSARYKPRIDQGKLQVHRNQKLKLLYNP